jgi:hypothetical protein
VPWGATFTVRGRVVGGYVPGGQILRVLIGSPQHLQLVANPAVQHDGRFTFKLHATGSGGALRVAVAVGTLTERDFPWWPSRSPLAWITIG